MTPENKLLGSEKIKFKLLRRASCLVRKKRADSDRPRETLSGKQETNTLGRYTPRLPL